MVIDPELNSTIRSTLDARDDFPAPVLPTTPIFSLPLICMFKLRRTDGKPGL